MSYICPVCGYDRLTKNPLIPGSFEICPSCGFQFGYTDDDLGCSYEQWRNKWIANSMPWDGIGIHPPVDWNPRQQLLNIGVKV